MDGDETMLKMISGMGFGLVLATSLSATEITGISHTPDEALVGSAEQLESPVRMLFDDPGRDAESEPGSRC